MCSRKQAALPRIALQGAAHREAISPGGRLCLLLIKGYRYCISPLFPPCCRYTPTCSEYAAEAVTKYGGIRGSWLAIRRILRCHPFVRGGYDPVK